MRGLFAAMALAAVGVSQAAVLFSDDFESGSFSSGWYSPTGFGSAAVVAGNGTTNYSIDSFAAKVTTASGQARHDFTPSTTGLTVAEAWVYVDTYPPQGRRYISLLSYSGANSTGTLNNLWSLGTNNAVASNKWFARVAIGTGAVNWVPLTAGPDVATDQWVKLAIHVDATNATFFINDVQAGQFSRAAAGDPNVFRVGDGVSSTHDMWYDNVMVTDAVPEPGTMLVLGAGLAALARRRRAKKS